MTLEKVIKALGEDTVKELEALSKEQLHNRIVAAETSMEEVAKDLEANLAYQEIKENKKALEAGKREVDKRQKAIIKFALHVLSGNQS